MRPSFPIPSAAELDLHVFRHPLSPGDSARGGCIVDIDRRQFIQAGLAAGARMSISSAQEPLPVAPSEDDRKYWVQTLKRISYPLLHALSERQLKKDMPVEAPHGNAEDRRRFTHLEAMGRLLAGIAPWLESGPDSGEEAALRAQFADWSRKGIQSATDPDSPDCMNFKSGEQPLVDAAFLALAIVRAPKELWHKLDSPTQQRVIAALESTRHIRPPYNNWLLFSAMVEAALSLMGVWWDPARIDYAVRTLDTWYKGDGIYGDGPALHCDYYNSFVIHPMLLNSLDTVAKSSPAWDSFRPNIFVRAQRYAAIQERLVAPDATFPPIGRSICYRFGAFHLLAEIALRRQLPEFIAPEQVRSALTAIIRRTVEAPGTFDEAGWLTIGFCGHQPALAEPYISTGSLYLCSAAWLPLGLPPADPFWSGPTKPWTSKQAWDAAQIPPDHAIER